MIFASIGYVSIMQATKSTSSLWCTSFYPLQCWLAFPLWLTFLCVMALPLPGTFKGHKISMGFLEGKFLVQGFFGVLLEAQEIFFGSWLLAPFDHPCHLKSRVPPLGGPGSILHAQLASLSSVISSFFAQNEGAQPPAPQPLLDLPLNVHCVEGEEEERDRMTICW